METASWKFGGRSTSVSFNCPPCGVQFVFFGETGGPYLHGVIDGLLDEHAGHDFVMIEQEGGGNDADSNNPRIDRK